MLFFLETTLKKNKELVTINAHEKVHKEDNTFSNREYTSGYWKQMDSSNYP